MYSIENPLALFLILALIPAIITIAIRVRSITKNLGVPSTRIFYFQIIIRTIFFSLAWVCIVLAWAGISWGTKRVPVQKNGNAVSFVFDISYSMNATDGGRGATRLEAAGKYAELLLEKIDGVSVSVVIAKGDGIIAVPLTEDAASVSAILPVLSPALMTAGGTNLGRGVEVALRSFPASSAQACHVWIFTDGDETEETLASAVADCIRRGVSVSVVGFGETQEVQIVSGDGETPVMTSLKKANMMRLVNNANSEVDFNGKINLRNQLRAYKPYAQFVDSKENGSALKLLEQLNTTVDNPNLSSSLVVYETQTVVRSGMFLLLAVAFFTLAIVLSNIFVVIFEKAKESKRKKFIHLAVIFSVCIIFSSCGKKYNGAKDVLLGTWDFHQKDYNSAAANFLHATLSAADDVPEFAQYGLAVTYMTQQEYDAALIKLSQIPNDAHPQVLYASLYATAVIAYYNADYVKAAELFKEALKVDSTKIDAKVNLEIVMKNLETRKASGAEQELIKSSESDINNSKMEDTIFERIRENDIRRWKNSEQEPSKSDLLDY